MNVVDVHSSISVPTIRHKQLIVGHGWTRVRGSVRGTHTHTAVMRKTWHSLWIIPAQNNLYQCKHQSTCCRKPKNFCQISLHLQKSTVSVMCNPPWWGGGICGTKCHASLMVLFPDHFQCMAVIQIHNHLFLFQDFWNAKFLKSIAHFWWRCVCIWVGVGGLT